MQKKLIVSIYGALLLISLLVFFVSPRFGWFVNDPIPRGLLFFQGEEKGNIYYGSKNAKVEVNIKEGKIFSVTYTDLYSGNSETMEAGEDYSSIFYYPEKIAFSAKGAGINLWTQDKKEHGIVMLFFILFPGIAGLVSSFLLCDGIAKNRKMKRDICLIVMVLAALVFMGVGLRLFHWSIFYIL